MIMIQFHQSIIYLSHKLLAIERCFFLVRWVEPTWISVCGRKGIAHSNIETSHFLVWKEPTTTKKGVDPLCQCLFTHYPEYPSIINPPGILVSLPPRILWVSTLWFAIIKFDAPPPNATPAASSKTARVTWVPNNFRITHSNHTLKTTMYTRISRQGD